MPDPLVVDPIDCTACEVCPDCVHVIAFCAAHDPDAEVERLRARLERYEQAIYEHRNNVMSLGMRRDERTGEIVHGGEYDRRLWSELPEDAGSGGMW